MSEAFRAPVPYVPLPARVAVFLSGRGSNFEALAEGCRTGEVPAEIVAVVSDRPDAPGLEAARRLGLDAVAVDRKLFPSRVAQEEALAELVRGRGADVICLAGFMRILSPSFVDRFRLRILNIHPSLLPAFPGKEAQAQALAYGVKVTGVTVHFVDSGMDSGPIVAQEAMPVEIGDDTASLSSRLLRVEHRLYRTSLRKVLEGGWMLTDRSVYFPE
ncbi:MAG TPA: phosphoribosylglycinamide formyltransferase [Thermoanaerobaculia bacterium]